MAPEHRDTPAAVPPTARPKAPAARRAPGGDRTGPPTTPPARTPRRTLGPPGQAARRSPRSAGPMPQDGPGPAGSAPKGSPRAAGRRTPYRKIAVVSGIGTALEWYDSFIYGTAAPVVFNVLFSAELSNAAGTLAAFATFGAGFVARPLGGLFFGYLGDRMGRRAVLVTTLLIVGGATCAIGLLPGYRQINTAAPALLVVLRLAQGFGAGAEYGGAAIHAVEHAPAGRRGWFGSWAASGIAAGLLTATGVLALWSILSDRVGRRPVHGGAAVFRILFAVPYFLLLDQHSVPLAVVAVVLGFGVVSFSPERYRARIDV